MIVTQIAVALLIVALVGWLVNSYLPASGNTRTVVNTVLMLIVVGMALWAIDNFIPMAGPIKAILNIIVVVAVCVRVLQVLGLWGSTVRLWHNLTHHHTPTDAPRP